MPKGVDELKELGQRRFKNFDLPKKEGEITRPEGFDYPNWIAPKGGLSFLVAKSSSLGKLSFLTGWVGLDPLS